MPIKDPEKGRLLQVWYQMKSRCHKPDHNMFHHYGARGITVCERWLANFANFFQDMSPRPAGTWLERRDNDAGYSPENCYWATPKEQQCNKRTTKLNAEKVHQIRGLWAATKEGVGASTFSKIVAPSFNCHRNTIYEVVTGGTWQHIERKHRADIRS